MCSNRIVETRRLDAEGVDVMTSVLEVVARLEEFVEKKMVLDAIPGLSFAVTDRAEDILVKSMGVSCIASGVEVGDDSLFQIGSMSKSFTSIALLQLQEQGLLDVHNPVKDYLPWFEVRTKHPPMTLHHLMTHTAGIPCGSDSTVSPETEVWGLRHLETSAPPGEHFHYSNTGYKALGLVLEAVTGMPYSDVIRDGILKPLGMTRTEPVIANAIRARSVVGHTWFEDDRPPARNGALSPAPWFESNTGDGSISSTPRDMSKYLRMILNRGVGPDGRLISERSFEVLTLPHVDCGEDGEEERYGYGIGVEESGGRTILSHTGGMVGYTSSMLVDMGLGLGIVVLTNSIDAPQDVSRFFLRLLDASSSGSDLPEAEPPSQRHTPPDPTEYVGMYHGRSDTLRVKERDGLLWSEVDGSEAPMECVKQDYFRLDHPSFRLFLLRFIRSENKLVGVAYGGEEYLLDPADRTLGGTGAPSEHVAYVGHYRSHNPWLTNFRVISRGGVLLLVEPFGTEQVLVSTGQGAFRVGEDPRSPETLLFDMFVDGRALMANLSGGPYHRTFTP
jgi:D-alanyl-D-alanine carboxypeptidase